MEKCVFCLFPPFPPWYCDVFCTIATPIITFSDWSQKNFKLASAANAKTFPVITHCFFAFTYAFLAFSALFPEMAVYKVKLLSHISYLIFQLHVTIEQRLPTKFGQTRFSFLIQSKLKTKILSGHIEKQQNITSSLYFKILCLNLLNRFPLFVQEF